MPMAFRIWLKWKTPPVSQEIYGIPCESNTAQFACIVHWINCMRLTTYIAEAFKYTQLSNSHAPQRAHDTWLLDYLTVNRVVNGHTPYTIVEYLNYFIINRQFGTLMVRKWYFVAHWYLTSFSDLLYNECTLVILNKYDFWCSFVNWYLLASSASVLKF